MFRNMYSLNLHFYFNLNNISTLMVTLMISEYLYIINEKAFLKSSFCIIDIIKNQLHHEKRIKIKIIAEFLILIPKLKFHDKNNLKTVIKYQWYCRINTSHTFTNRGSTNVVHEEESKWRIPRNGIRVENHEDTIASIIPNAYFLSTGCVCYILACLFLFFF